MIDPRVTKLSELLVNHSTKLTKEDKVLIHAFDIPDECIAELVRLCQSKGAEVIVRLESNIVKRQLMHGMTEANAKTIAATEKYEMEQMTAYIALRGSDNYAELGDIPSDIQTMWSKV